MLCIACLSIWLAVSVPADICMSPGLCILCQSSQECADEVQLLPPRPAGQSAAAPHHARHHHSIAAGPTRPPHHAPGRPRLRAAHAQPHRRTRAPPSDTGCAALSLKQALQTLTSSQKPYRSPLYVFAMDVLGWLKLIWSSWTGALVGDLTWRILIWSS